MSSHQPFLLQLYRTGLSALEPAAAGLLLWRERKGKEDPVRLQERRGWPSLDRAHERAYAMLGARDPGAKLRARREAAQQSSAA